jgi:Bacterial conjugation TrbI-like protein
MDAHTAANQAEAGGNEVTAADIGRTGQPVQPGTASPAESKSAHTLGSIDFSDRPLEREYAMHGYVPAPPPPNPPVPPAPAPAPAATKNEKTSLVFVRTEERGQLDAAQAQPAIEQESSVTDLLPTGTRLVARLESPVSSAVAAPAVAVIEYNYERDGEIVVPAGARALGKLEQANRSGYVSLHFDTLQMPDGSTQKIDAGAMGLDYKPLEGHVTGRKRGARFLVESLTGLGTMATYLVGNNSSTLNAPFSSSGLLRERLAGNVAIAGQNELNELTLNQNVVVTLPGGTRFYLVLEEGAKAEATPAAEPRRSGRTQATSTSIPSLQELRQLLELKREMSEMYDQAEGPATNAPQQ